MRELLIWIKRKKTYSYFKISFSKMTDIMKGKNTVDIVKNLQIYFDNITNILMKRVTKIKQRRRILLAVSIHQITNIRKTTSSSVHIIFNNKNICVIGYHLQSI